VRQPVAHERQSLSLDAINPHPSRPLMREKTRNFKNLKVPGRRLPCMRKYRRNLTGSHRASVEIDREQNSAPHGVGQRREHSLIRVRSCH